MQQFVLPLLGLIYFCSVAHAEVVEVTRQSCGSKATLGDIDLGAPKIAEAPRVDTQPSSNNGLLGIVPIESIIPNSPNAPTVYAGAVTVMQPPKSPADYQGDCTILPVEQPQPTN